MPSFIGVLLPKLSVETHNFERSIVCEVAKGEKPSKTPGPLQTANQWEIDMSKIVVITGATSGVGRACVVEFAKKGYDVALLARGQEGLDAAARQARAHGRRALTISVDVADAGAVDDAAAKVETELGPIDVWVNDAMTTIFGEFRSIEPDEFKRATEVTYLGSVYGAKAALKRMQERDRGVIVQVGSALAYRGIPLQTVYCGSKHALQGFMESLRCELLHERSGVRAISVHLPGVNTPQFDHCMTRVPKRAQPVPPIYQPEVCAGAIAWAAEHPHRREVWVGGSTVATILGNYVMPGLLDRYLARTNYKAQQRPENVPDDQPANLWEATPGDPGAHGDFDQEAHGRSYQVVATENRPLVLAAAGVAAAIALITLKR
jgi:NAD(P)-dependent dehydrogenase (short-subunit alcohol dehydrogenase family)